jgi:hypothetical protein
MKQQTVMQIFDKVRKDIKYLHEVYYLLKKKNLELLKQDSHNIDPFTCATSSTEPLQIIKDFTLKLLDEIKRLEEENMKLEYYIYCSFKLPTYIFNNLRALCKKYAIICRNPHITILNFGCKNIQSNNDFTNRIFRNHIKQIITKHLQMKPITPGYKILGLNVPISIRNILLNKNSINEIQNFIPNIECFLVVELFTCDLSTMYTELLNELHLTEDEIMPKPFYTKENYEKFSIHITLAKFSCISNAVEALKEIFKLSTTPFSNLNQIFENVNLTIYLNEN